MESTVRWETLQELGQANGIAVPEHHTGMFDGFGPFAEHNSLVRDCLRQPEDFRRIAREFCADEAARGTGYAELTFTAAAHGERLGMPDLPLEAVLDGLAEGQAAHDIECRLILDHSRRRSVERARQTVALAIRHAGRGVIGVGLAGDESYPGAPFAEIFREAGEAGLHIVHHAGEIAGPASIREAINLGAERLGHGVRVLEDAGLVAEVRQRGIPLEVCPSSNVALGVAPSWQEHPLPRLRDAGLIVTLNADIPADIKTSLAQEYGRARAAFDYDDEVLAELAHASIDASFAPEATKQRLHRGTNDWLATAD
jgi:adenosine deaminase